MKIEKLPSGSYRVRKMYKGNKYTFVFDHKPTEREIILILSEKIKEDNPCPKGTFAKYAHDYIANRKGVISPATERTYEIKLDQLSAEFKRKNIHAITSEDIQKEISLFSQTHAPKTVLSLHGFIKSVFKAYRPNFVFSTKLPQAIQKDEYAPDNDDIKRILELAKQTKYSVAFQLGVLGLRRAEICALSIDDLNGNELRVHCDIAYNNGKWVKKENPKTNASNRTIILPDNLVQEIQEQGYIYDGHPNALNKAIHRFQKQLGIPEFRFHDLRVYFASYAHDMGISEVNIMSMGGWATSSVMKNVYRKSFEKSQKESMKKLSNSLLNS